MWRKPELEFLEERIAPAVVNVGPGRTDKTITKGVTDANPGDFVVVDNGTYTERVFVNKTVTILAANSLGAVIQAPAGALASRNTQTAGANPNDTTPIVMVYGSAAVSVTEAGFVINGPLANQVSNTAGIYVRDGATANIYSNFIENITDSPANATLQDGVAIQVGFNTKNANNVTFMTTGVANIGGSGLGNTINTYQKDGISVQNGSTASILNNVIAGSGPNLNIAQNGIDVNDSSVVTIKGNTISGNEHSGNQPGNPSGSDFFKDVQAGGITLFTNGGAGNGSVVSGNVLQSNDYGIDSLTSGTTTISGNFLGTGGANTANRYEGIIVDQGVSMITGNIIVGGILGVQDASFNGSTANTTAVFTGNSISGAQIGIVMRNDPNGTSFAANSSIGDGFSTANSITNNSVASIVGNLINGNCFASVESGRTLRPG